MIYNTDVIKAFEYVVEHTPARTGHAKAEVQQAVDMLAKLKSEAQTLVLGRLRHQIDCNEIKCAWNIRGACKVEHITLQSKGITLVGHLICAEAEYPPDDEPVVKPDVKSEVESKVDKSEVDKSEVG